MSIITDVENELHALEAKAVEVVDHGKTILEQHLPGIAAAVQKAETEANAIANEPFIKAYIGNALVVPEHLVNLGLDFLAKLVAASQGEAPPAPAAAAGDGPVGLDAQPDAA